MSSCPLPPEILDLIIDNLCNEPGALKTCCLLSKAWIHRTRKHLFSRIGLNTSDRDLSKWKETFLDFANSPAHYAQILFIVCTPLILDQHTDTFPTFCHVSNLTLKLTKACASSLSLVPLHGFSPAIRTLRLIFHRLTNSTIFGLICSFPLLEDLALFGHPTQEQDGLWTAPSTSPSLTGCLDLDIPVMQFIASQLLDLPGGLHFKMMVMRWRSPTDAESTMALISGCPHTLESLKVTNYLIETPEMSSPNLYETIRLRDVDFLCVEEASPQWIVEILRSVETKSLRAILLDMSQYASSGTSHSHEFYRAWSNLDRLLVQLFMSLRPKLRIQVMSSRDAAVILLPELMERRKNPRPAQA